MEEVALGSPFCFIVNLILITTVLTIRWKWVKFLFNLLPYCSIKGANDR